MQLMTQSEERAPMSLEVRSTCATVADQYKLESGYSFGSGLPRQSLQDCKIKVSKKRHQRCIKQGLK